MPRLRVPPRSAFAASLALWALAHDVEAAKTDVVVLLNGDRLTCELKLLQRGKLQVKTDGLGTVDVEWNRVKSVSAGGLFEVEDLLGRLYFGSLQPSVGDGKLDVVGLAGTSTIDIGLVVRFARLRTSFWKRLSGSIDVGYSYTSSSRLTQFSLDGQVKHRRPTFELQLNVNSLVTTQPDVADTQRSSADLGYVRFRAGRQIVFGQVRAEQNRELGYDLRAGLQGGWGHYLVRRQGNDLLAAIGLNVNHEVPVDGEPVENIEGVIALDWENFAFSTPKTDISVQLLFYPSLSQWPRYRFDLDARIKRELFKDFSVSLKGYQSYDSQPATEGASHNDWGITLGLGYSFN